MSYRNIFLSFLVINLYTNQRITKYGIKVPLEETVY